MFHQKYSHLRYTHVCSPHRPKLILTLYDPVNFTFSPKIIVTTGRAIVKLTCMNLSGHPSFTRRYQTASWWTALKADVRSTKTTHNSLYYLRCFSFPKGLQRRTLADYYSKTFYRPDALPVNQTAG